MLLAAFEQLARGGGHGPRFIFPLLLILLLLSFAGFLLRRRKHGHPHGHGPYRRHGSSPMQTLADRFARGEIDRSEFEHRKAVLLGEDMVPPAPAAPPEPAPNPSTGVDAANPADSPDGPTDSDDDE